MNDLLSEYQINGSNTDHLQQLLEQTLNEDLDTPDKTRLKGFLSLADKGLKVFQLFNRDRKAVTERIHRYHLSYCLIRDKENKSDTAFVYLIVTAKDAPRAQRVIRSFYPKGLKIKTDKAMTPAMILDEILKKTDHSSKTNNHSDRRISVREKLSAFRVREQQITHW